MPEYSTSKVMQTMPRLPLKGSLNLTYRCNNNCRHCWLRIPPGAYTPSIGGRGAKQWTTNQPVTGEVRYGTDPADLDQIAYDDRGAGTSDDTHYVTLLGLTPETTYYFDVVSDGTAGDNNGNHYSVTTGPTLGLPASDTIYGRVFKEDGTTPAAGAIVYITLRDADGAGSPGEAGVMSALVGGDGWWQANLGNARLADGTGYFTYSAAGDAAMLVAQGPADGFVSRMVDTGDLEPAAPLTLVRQRRPYLPLVVKE